MHALLSQIRATHVATVDPALQITYQYCGHEITLQTDPDGGVAGVVWFAYPRVMNWIENQYNANKDVFKGTTAIELGAGTGLAGLLLALCGAKTALTDRAETLPLLDINISLNNVQENACAKELNWGESLEGFSPPYDLLIVCDCIYNLKYGPVLLDSMVSLSGENTKIIFAFSTRNKPEEEKFLQSVAQHFQVTRLEGGDEKDVEPNVFLFTKKSEEMDN